MNQSNDRSSNRTPAGPGGGAASKNDRSSIPESAFLPPIDERRRALWTRFTFLIHLRPVRLPARTLRWTHTFGLGGTCLVLALLLAFTGILMMLVYKPVPDMAYDSVRALEREVSFGSLVRGVHYWSANLLVFAVMLHIARVFLTGGFRGERRFTWVLGGGMLLTVLTSNFTGYLLPWDQLSYWAITVSTGMLEYAPGIGGQLQRLVLGGNEIGAETLIIFYTIHTTIVPALLIILMGWHFWRVRRAGGVILPPAGPGEDDAEKRPERVLFVPHLMNRELSQALVIVAMVIALATLFGAPLGDRANPGMSPNPTKAPWYFVGFQELLIHLHPLFAVFVIPCLAAAGFFLLPYVAPADRTGGRWFLSARGRTTALCAAAASLLLTPIVVLVSERADTGGATWWASGLLPVLIVAAVLTSLWFSRRRLGASGDETLQAIVVFMVVSFIVLTVIGQWFRGIGMVLHWPWGA